MLLLLLWLPWLLWPIFFYHCKIGNQTLFSVANCNKGSLSANKDFLTSVLMDAIDASLGQTTTWCPPQNGRITSVWQPWWDVALESKYQFSFIFFKSLVNIAISSYWKFGNFLFFFSSSYSSLPLSTITIVTC